MSDAQASSAEANAAVVLEGDLSFDTVTQLAERHQDLLASDGPTWVDLSRVTWVDSAGLALLVEWTRQARAGGQSIEFTQIPCQLVALARVSGLEGILPFDDTRQSTRET